MLLQGHLTTCWFYLSLPAFRRSETSVSTSRPDRSYCSERQDSRPRLGQTPRWRPVKMNLRGAPTGRSGVSRRCGPCWTERVVGRRQLSARLISRVLPGMDPASFLGVIKGFRVYLPYLSDARTAAPRVIPRTDPTDTQITRLMRHLGWTQQPYREMLPGRSTFAIAGPQPIVSPARERTSF